MARILNRIPVGARPQPTVLKHAAIAFSTDPMRIEDLKRAFAEREWRLYEPSGTQLKLWEPGAEGAGAREGERRHQVD